MADRFLLRFERPDDDVFPLSVVVLRDVASFHDAARSSTTMLALVLAAVAAPLTALLIFTSAVPLAQLASAFQNPQPPVL